MFKKIQEIFKGKKIYLVGGPVRSQILNQKVNDWDCCTPLSPEEIENTIRQAGKKPYLIGKRFGTIAMKVDGEMVEITTFRSEKYNKGSRKPEVSFVKDITADLSRRDFTINAMASSGKKIIDPFGGRDDLENKIIRCVGQPTHRIKEDALRSLRAGRFASQLGFTVEDKTEKAVKQLAHKILEVSRERWMIELDKILMSDKPSIGILFLFRTRLINFMIPELALQYNYDQKSIYHNLTLLDHTLKALDATPKDIIVRLAILFHDSGKPFIRSDKFTESGLWIKTNYIKHELISGEIVLRYASYLKWSNSRRDAVYNLVVNHMSEDSPLKQYDQQGK